MSPDADLHHRPEPVHGPDILEHGSWAAENTGTAGKYSTLEEACAAEFPRLLRLLTLYCGNREVARDLAQEALARGCVHWQRVQRMDDQKAWYSRVALNLANSRWRRMKAERRAVRTISARPPGGQPGDPTDALAVRAVVAELTPRQRSAVVLRFFHDLDLATTAQVMHCSEGTVKKLTARGLATLRDRLDFDRPTGDSHD